jgi:MFS family permease
MNGRKGLGIGGWVLGIGLLDFSLEQTIVVPALPAMQHRYHTTPTAVAWILTGFLLASAVSTPLAGRLGDRYGKKHVLLHSLGLFVVGSVICALGGSIAVVVTGRVVQGLGAGVGPLALALVRDHLPPEEVPHAVGILVGLAGAGGVFGFLACGLLVEYVSIPSIFWCLAVIGFGCLITVWRTIAESPIRAGTSVDWFGALLLGASLSGVLLAISEWHDWHGTSAAMLITLAASAASLAAFARREVTATAPLIDPRALMSRPIASANIAVFAVGYALLAGYVLVPLLGGLPASTGYGLGLSTIGLSLALTPSALGAVFGGLASGRLVASAGARYAAATGTVLGLFAYGAFIVLPRSLSAVVVLMIPVGLGTGLAIAAISDLAVLAASEEESGITVALTSVMRAVGSALGAQVAVAIYTAAPKLPSGIPSNTGITNAFVMSLLTTALAMAAVVLIPRRSADPTIFRSA